MSRNPMYLGMLIALFGFALLYQGALSSFAFVFVFMIIADRWYIRFEELAMRNKFGRSYEEYCERTRRWL